MAIGWKAIAQKNPEFSNEQIAEIYINYRYRLTNEPNLGMDVIDFLNDDGDAINPLNLAWAILLVENPKESDTIFDHYSEWRTIMKEEIEKIGVNPSFRFD